jgi:hypothetical protein
MKIKIVLKDCLQNCGKQHINGTHPVPVSYYNRYGKCKWCGEALGNKITDDEDLLERGYHTNCYVTAQKMKGLP